MLLSIRSAIIAAVLLAALTLVVGSAFAKEQGGTRPGWGHGDDNHTHTGPPGQTRHPHGGPPGQQ